MDRLTYKSLMGDYGSAKVFEDEYSERCALRNALGKYEDLGYTPDELKNIIKQSQCDIAQHIENCEDCGFCNKGEQNNE